MSPTAEPKRTSCVPWRASATARRGSRRCPRTSGATASARELRGHGVDVAHVGWREGGRIGTYFIEYGVAPRPIRVVYDRKDSAFASLDEAEVDWATVSRTRVVHVTGITAALGPRPRRLFERAVESARTSGALLSLDVNHRTALWTYEAARAYLEPILARVGLLFVGIEDARRVFGLTGEPETVAAELRKLAPQAIVALTLGDQGSVVLTDQPRRPTRLYSLDVVADRVGAGDAFAAGFLHGWLTTRGRAARPGPRHGARGAEVHDVGRHRGDPAG